VNANRRAGQPTIHDVAAAAGVSVTTVSHALNGKGRVDPETRARVAKVVRRLGYRANRHARSLRSGRSEAVALLLPVGGDSRSDEVLYLDFYMQVASSAAAAAFAHHYALVLLPPTTVNGGPGGFLVDGGIVVDPSPNDPLVSHFHDLGLPVVTIERDHGRPQDPWYVASETEANTRRMLDHLAARGARRIALLTPDSAWGWATETLGAYRSWSEEHGTKPLAVPVAMSPGEQNAFAAARHLLASRHPPDAVFAVAARFVRGVMRAARETGTRVPEDLLVAAGVDGVPAREAEPPVTALDLHPERQAEAAVEMLLSRLNGGHPQAPRYIGATLRVRPSTGRPGRAGH
jgi:DNA-binding LacI/PurR family transcriptional regulator